ncbi:interferon-induced GTP-binding Mx [Fusarium pseudocircinatum]|uniref:Interferon-induced GTP-binding Mx n=1 Tax=Fusarium pseudocircinatum TaxID=56676 RepID=A0A8H5KQG6_9HYPO|nr:interferon-induced GTP-binding Mx [Fusarium pseudocircinatum]
MTTAKTVKSEQGLGNRALLDKMDKLRELGISNMVPLPQMVVVGDQSAGKSSVLESLTGFHFPRSVTLCTRHATEIICRREETESIVVSIHAVDADEEQAKSFHRTATNLDVEEFAQIFQDAAKVMGIKSESSDSSTGSAFSRDVLRVEISGPDEDHLTVIDVPGMFENVTPGVTTKEDTELVKNMVQNYIQESRTIILAVVPCNGDIANQKILTYAKEVDPEGKRTLGVLTKPDLAVEQATKAVVIDLVNGKRRDLQLGYCVVKNRSADDSSSSAEERTRAEKDFFSKAPWTTLSPDRLGIPALKVRVQQLLMDRTKSEFPKVRTELGIKQRECETLLKLMGESRSTEAEQRIYLGRVAAQFVQIKNFGLDAYYTRHKIFENEDLKLITRIREINEGFGQVLYEKGHTRNFFVSDEDEAAETTETNGATDHEEDEDEDVKRVELYNQATFTIPLLGEEDLVDDILYDAYHCPKPHGEDILTYIEKEYLTSRGYEIGTFSGEMLPVTFKEQSKKWQPMARAHVSNAILIVHHFIRNVLNASCPDFSIREELWAFILEDLQNRYRRAVDHVEFLLEVEFEGKSITYNPNFNDSLNRLKFSHVKDLGKEVEATILKPLPDSYEAAAQRARQLVEEHLDQETTLNSTRRDIHNVLHTFYEIARSRFVDVVCQQVIDHFLLHAPSGPLSVLSQDVVLRMTAEELETIAGEDMLSRDRREKLTRDVANLKEALKVLRG